MCVNILAAFLFGLSVFFWGGRISWAEFWMIVAETVHPQNVRLQNVRFQNVRFQNVWNVRFTKRQVFKTSGCKKNIHLYSVLVVGGNPQVLLQPCLQAKWWLCFILYFRGLFCHISPKSPVICKNDTLFTSNRNANLAIPILFCLISISNLKTGRFETRRF